MKIILTTDSKDDIFPGVGFRFLMERMCRREEEEVDKIDQERNGRKRPRSIEFLSSLFGGGGLVESRGWCVVCGCWLNCLVAKIESWQN